MGVTIHETWEAMVECYKAGLVRNIGVCNFQVRTHWLRAAARSCVARTTPRSRDSRALAILRSAQVHPVMMLFTFIVSCSLCPG